MRKGRRLAARLAAIAAVESWSGRALRGDPAPLRFSRHQRRALGDDCTALRVAERACQLQQRPFAPIARCLARTMRERCRT